MPKRRTPLAKALVAGANLRDPARYRTRQGPRKARPVGEPYATMTEAQKIAWIEFRNDLPWLTSSHRVLLRLACLLTARMNDAEFGVSATHALSSILSKMGATPTNEISCSDDDEGDETDKFFERHH